ncbi:MAG: sulfotransferase [Desulfobacteraceae bacterium]|nr:sulfotransferase [Desulfobacteraceae bacterium]
MNSPIIIIGMHRSGTTLVARILESMGLFLGAYKDENCESNVFISINDWILRISGGSWDTPDAIDRLLGSDMARRIILNHIGTTLQSPHILRYSGLKHYRKLSKKMDGNFHWGWKDPRNTITLPIWLDLFPDARIIHVCRHGVDVADSLKKRQRRWYQRAMFPPRYRRLRYLLRPFGGHYLRSVGFQNHAEGIKLWAAYMQKAEASLLALGNQSMVLRYEDLIREPENNIQLLLDFCHLAKDERNLSKALGIIDRSRAFAYEGHAELQALASANSELLAQYGY